MSLLPTSSDLYGRDDSPEDDRDTLQTLASSMREFRHEHGRTYAGRGSHSIPNDELNAEHEKIGHHMFQLLMRDKLFLAPVQKPSRVLDIGSGTGLWAEDMADKYYEAEKILGVDLTPYDPVAPPPNLELRYEDIRGEWTPDNTNFDFVHMRLLFSFIGGDWPELYREIFR